MTKIKLGIFSIGLIFLFLACTSTTNQNGNTNTNTSQTSSTPKSTPPPDTLTEARAIYGEQCAICHKPDGSGGQTTVGKKKINAASLKAGKALTATDEKLTSIITNGDDDMPSFKDDLSAEQIKALVQFIRKEFQGK